LLVGERADSDLVRFGESEALVEGRFAVDGTDLVASRKVTADGRSRCALDGSMVTVGTLARVLGPLVDLHGQHEHQSLLSTSKHAFYLDRHIGVEALDAAARYRSARDAHIAAGRELDRLSKRHADIERRADYFRFVVGEIDAIDPSPGEDEELETRLPALTHADRLVASVREAAGRVRGDGGAVDGLGAATEVLRRVAGLDPALDALVTRLEGIAAETEDAGAELRVYADALEHDPADLDAVQARLAALAGLKKKYGPSLALVLEAREEARAGLAQIDSGDAERAEARAGAESARAAYVDAAAALRAVRRAHAESFTAALAREFEGVNMGDARVEIAFDELDPAAWGGDGPDRVEFRFAAASGEPARPLAKIASGGEMSRVMLALKTVLGRADDVPVLVFDEVDSGIGGVTAHAVGQRLAALARDRQVIVVTHLPQVAAVADVHLVVERTIADGRGATCVRRVAGEERAAEVARMLSGSDTEASRAHADELIARASARGGVDA
ncbi:MAG TPA: DNA repair protein RecN, partial [Coriobacteriia bacterium]|nr:DNA repair protein RecN [Coriobacteriia bacterium]